jgi:hypothetical protein
MRFTGNLGGREVGVMADSSYEPSAGMRQFATQMQDMFQALVQAGFSESQALTMLGQVIRGMVAGQTGGKAHDA